MTSVIEWIPLRSPLMFGCDAYGSDVVSAQSGPS